MKKSKPNFKEKSVKELEKEETNLRQQMSKTILNKTVNPDKDSNLVFKLRKQLTSLLTVMNDKKELGRLKIESKE